MSLNHWYRIPTALLYQMAPIGLSGPHAVQSQEEARLTDSTPCKTDSRDSAGRESWEKSLPSQNVQALSTPSIAALTGHEQPRKCRNQAKFVSNNSSASRKHCSTPRIHVRTRLDRLSALERCRRITSSKLRPERLERVGRDIYRLCW